MIPGVPGAHGTFGPPLNLMALRTYIAGEFPNDLENLTRWIQAPTAMKPKTTMPDLGLSEQEAAHAAEYLETLR
jgi:cytochrome c